MDTTNLLTPSVGVMVKVENLCTEIEAACEEKLFYFSERVKTISDHLKGSVLETVKACVEQARFHACQHTLFNLCFGISSDDIKVIRVDGDRKNVYLRDYDLFSQGVDDDTTAAAAKDVTTTQKIVRIVQRLQRSVAQDAEPEKIARKSKAELQAEETAKAAEVASNDLEAAIYQYGDMLKKPQAQMLDKLVLLLTTLKHLPSKAKLTDEHVLRLSSMQTNDADCLKVIRHFLTASDAANNVDHMGRTFVPSGKRFRGVKRQRKELVALSLVYFEKFRRALLNIAADDALKEDALNTCEQVREWAYYCDLADKNDLSRFRTFVNVKNYFATVGRVVLAPCGSLPAGSIAFDDELTKQYTAAMTRRGSDNARELEDDDRPESSSSDDSVDFSLQLRRFVPLSTQEMHRAENFVPAARPAPLRKTAAAISDSDSASDNLSGGEGYPTSTGAAGAAAARAAAPAVSPTTRSARIVRREFSRTLSPSLSFSPMKAGSATQRAARAKDKALHSSDSDDAS